jgi:hypothetical protein
MPPELVTRIDPPRVGILKPTHARREIRLRTGGEGSFSLKENVSRVIHRLDLSRIEKRFQQRGGVLFRKK